MQNTLELGPNASQKLKDIEEEMSKMNERAEERSSR